MIGGHSGSINLCSWIMLTHYLTGPNHLNCSLTPSGCFLHTQSHCWVVPAMNGAMTMSGNDTHLTVPEYHLKNELKLQPYPDKSIKPSSTWWGTQGQLKTIHCPREDEREKRRRLFSADSSVSIPLSFIFPHQLPQTFNSPSQLCFLEIFLVRLVNLLWILIACCSSWLAYVPGFCCPLLHLSYVSSLLSP